MHGRSIPGLFTGCPHERIPGPETITIHFRFAAFRPAKPYIDPFCPMIIGYTDYKYSFGAIDNGRYGDYKRAVPGR